MCTHYTGGSESVLEIYGRAAKREAKKPTHVAGADAVPVVLVLKRDAGGLTVGVAQGLGGGSIGAAVGLATAALGHGLGFARTLREC